MKKIWRLIKLIFPFYKIEENFNLKIDNPDIPKEVVDIEEPKVSSSQEETIVKPIQEEQVPEKEKPVETKKSIEYHSEVVPVKIKEFKLPSNSYKDKCKGKIGYPYKEVANQVATELNNKDFEKLRLSLQVMNSYQCPFCKKFHVGHFSVKSENCFYTLYNLVKNNSRIK